MKRKTVTFANFICRFGDEKVLLDYAKEIVIPAFTNDTYVRRYGKHTHYHFYKVHFVKLDELAGFPVFALAGRFVKDTMLTRHQVFEEQVGLIRDEQEMRSSPSAFFVLLLNNHRLIYFPETPHAPHLHSFAATTKQFLRKQHKKYLDELYSQRMDGEDRVTKKALVETHPTPTLEVIPLTGQDDIATFVRQYKVLKRLDFRLVLPNDDIDAGEILGQMRKFLQTLNADKSEIKAANSRGLDIEASIEAIASATSTGNQDVKLNGVDQDGNKLSGNNESFQIRAPVNDVPNTIAGLRQQLYEIYKHLTDRETIQAPKLDQAGDKARELERLL